MNDDLLWYPQDQHGDGDGLPLQLPPGGTRDGDPNVHYCLALWAFDRGLDYAMAVREDGQVTVKVWINRGQNDWEWMKDPVYEV